MKKINILLSVIAVFHGVIALEGIAVTGEHGAAGRAAVAALEGSLQPEIHIGEILTHEELFQKLLRDLQRVGAAETQHLFRLGIHFKRHVKRAVNAGDGIVRIGAGFAYYIIIAAGRGSLIHGVVLSVRFFRKDGTAPCCAKT